MIRAFTSILLSLLLLGPIHQTVSDAKESPPENPQVGQSAVLNLYSSRQADLLRPVLDLFTEKTGIEVRLLTSKSDTLIERLVREGANSPADILITTDVARLVRAANKSLLKEIKSDDLLDSVPAHLRDPDNQWVGLSIRSRVIAYNPQRFKDNLPTAYLDLADKIYKGRVCMRSSNNEYNQSLLASLMYHHGSEMALDWAKGVVANLFQHPQGNDRGQLNLIASGVCDFSLVNSYYMGLWLLDPANLKRKYTPKLLFPEQGDEQTGAHINISGGGIVASSPRPEMALRFLLFLVSEQGQRAYSHANQEYPINPDMEPGEDVKSLGWPVKFDNMDIKILGTLNQDAVKIFDQAGWK